MYLQPNAVPSTFMRGQSGWVGAPAAVTVTAAASEETNRRDVTRFKTPRSESTEADGAAAARRHAAQVTPSGASHQTPSAASIIWPARADLTVSTVCIILVTGEAHGQRRPDRPQEGWAHWHTVDGTAYDVCSRTGVTSSLTGW